VLLSFLDNELAAEENRQDSLEKRGLALITVAGALVSVLLALPKAAGRAIGSSSLSTVSAICFVLAGVAFAATACLAVWTNAPRRTRLLDPDAFLSVAADLWGKTGDDAARAVFGTRAAQLAAVQSSNDRRAVLLAIGMASLAAAIAATATAALVLLLGS
jgi:hypothetical protein